MKKRAEKPTKEGLRELPEDASRMATVRDFRFLRTNLLDAATRALAGSRDPGAPLIVRTGWMIYHAGRQGLLRSIIDIEKVVEKQILSFMEKRYEVWIRRIELLRANPMFEQGGQREWMGFSEEVAAGHIKYLDDEECDRMVAEAQVQNEANAAAKASRQNNVTAFIDWEERGSSTRRGMMRGEVELPPIVYR